ncbi:MAG TPA: DUF547 domain-containing protein [Gammaproteobacteria bacterium]|nr:DUF547 domain-containing protein [Gammaproteobacteria bacterium]
MRKLIWRVLMMSALMTATAASAFDHAYANYDRLLVRHVRWIANGHASVVDYDGLKRQRTELDAVLKSFSVVDRGEFESWSRSEQMAFLINAYNGFTLQLILSRYPDLKSIRDLGSLLRSPWKQTFFTLLGAPRALDWIEHDTLRPRYRDARVHFAVNCASLGCPALRPEPYVAAQLDAQLDDQQRRFLADRTRNRFNAADGVLHLSQIFKWYGEDFTAEGKSLKTWVGRHAEWLADTDADRQRLRGADYRIEHLSYDWMLNAGKPMR